MLISLYLILAHFLADFPFQSRALVKYKQAHFMGVVLHSLTHLITSAILLMPFISERKIWEGIAIIFIFHNIFDQVKISINKKSKLNKFFSYIADQIAHLVVICLVAKYYIGDLAPGISEVGATLYTDSSIVLYVLLLTLSTYFYDVTRWTYRNSKKAQPYNRDYGLIARNAIIVTIAFVIYWVTR